MKPRENRTQATREEKAGRFFRVTYSNAYEEDPKLFQCRDGMAFNELSALLPPMGYEYGTAIHLYPDDSRSLAELDSFRPTDLLVMATRPPLHDHSGLHPRKWIRGSKNAFEAAVFAECMKYFEFCTRKHVILTKDAFGLLKEGPEKKKWQHVELFERSGAEVMQHFDGPVGVRPPNGERYTVAFFLRANNVPGLNCGLVTSFGMDGYGTVIWNRIIRTRYPHWIASPRFVMAAIVFKKPIPDRPITPAFADDSDLIEVRLLTELL